MRWISKYTAVIYVKECSAYVLIYKFYGILSCIYIFILCLFFVVLKSVLNLFFYM